MLTPWSRLPRISLTVCRPDTAIPPAIRASLTKPWHRTRNYHHRSPSVRSYEGHAFGSVVVTRRRHDPEYTAVNRCLHHYCRIRHRCAEPELWVRQSGLDHRTWKGETKSQSRRAQDCEAGRAWPYRGRKSKYFTHSRDSVYAKRLLFGGVSTLPAHHYCRIHCTQADYLMSLYRKSGGCVIPYTPSRDSTQGKNTTTLG